MRARQWRYSAFTAKHGRRTPVHLRCHIRSREALPPLQPMLPTSVPVHPRCQNPLTTPTTIMTTEAERLTPMPHPQSSERAGTMARRKRLSRSLAADAEVYPLACQQSSSALAFPRAARRKGRRGRRRSGGRTLVVVRTADPKEPCG